jgi:hypothetical protein
MTLTRSVFAGVVVLVLAGCGAGVGEGMGSVSGVVTMDKQPLKEALVKFVPADGQGRPSHGITDENGRYDLFYSTNTRGALVGEHKVLISTFRDADMDEDGNAIPATEETVPARFNSKSELSRKVEAGSNSFDFELTSEGEITQPNVSR